MESGNFFDRKDVILSAVVGVEGVTDSVKANLIPGICALVWRGEKTRKIRIDYRCCVNWLGKVKERGNADLIANSECVDLFEGERGLKSTLDCAVRASQKR